MPPASAARRRSAAELIVTAAVGRPTVMAGFVTGEGGTDHREAARPARDGASTAWAPKACMNGAAREATNVAALWHEPPPGPGPRRTSHPGPLAAAGGPRRSLLHQHPRRHQRLGTRPRGLPSLGTASSASFKHVSPAGAALAARSTTSRARPSPSALASIPGRSPGPTYAPATPTPAPPTAT